MKIYIAGPITNDPNYFEKFRKANEFLKKQGHIVMNPCKEDGFDYKEYIDMGLCELSKCDAIYLLKGFEHSPGTMLEKHYAEVVGIKVLEERLMNIGYLGN